MKTLLVIDDSAAFRESIGYAVEGRGWVCMASGDLGKIRAWLDHHQPDVVLLDWNIVNQQLEDYVDELKRRDLTASTLLMSARLLDGERVALIKDAGLAGYRRKPLDLNRLDEEIRLRTQELPSPWPGIEAVVNGLDVAVDIFDDDLRILWRNKKAASDTLTPAQFLIIKWLYAALNETGHGAARRLDWDGEKRRFLESRMFRVSTSGALWVERDWRPKGDRPHDHELLNLVSNPTRVNWLKGVAELLAQRYAISRFRVYKIAELPYEPTFENDAGLLVIPLFQSGGGFRASEKVWCESGFLARSNGLIQSALLPDFSAKPEHVSDQHPKTGCAEIRYGSEGTYQVVLPVSRGGKTVALFEFDRRFDHAACLEGSDRDVVEIARRMASDEAGQLNDDQWQLMQGLVVDIGKRLTERLADDETRQSQDWHHEIDRALLKTFAEDPRSPEMTYDGISQVCAMLLDGWREPKISGRIMGATLWRDDQGRTPLDAWYIAIQTSQGHWCPVAGSGDAYRRLRHGGERPLAEPHLTSLQRPAWQAVVIQDFQDWIKRSGTTPYRDLGTDRVGQIGGWSAVPMKVDGVIGALMIVHSPYPHYFTRVRVGLLEQAAKRLLPLLAAARRETRARSAFTAAVMHEVKNDAHTARILLEELSPQLPPSQETLNALTHYLDGLTLLGQDSLDLFQMGRSDRIEDSAHREVRQQYRLDKLVDGLTAGWRELYDTTALTVALPMDAEHRWIEVEHALAFRRVVRGLLHNAFRHGRDWVKLTVGVGPPQSPGDLSRLELTVANLAKQQIAVGLAEDLSPVQGGLGTSALARGRLGLAIARQLAAEAGADLGPLQFERAADGEARIEVSTALTWPVREMAASDDQ